MSLYPRLRNWKPRERRKCHESRCSYEPVGGGYLCFIHKEEYDKETEKLVARRVAEEKKRSSGVYPRCQNFFKGIRCAELAMSGKRYCFRHRD